MNANKIINFYYLKNTFLIENNFKKAKLKLKTALLKGTWFQNQLWCPCSFFFAGTEAFPGYKQESFMKKKDSLSLSNPKAP